MIYSQPHPYEINLQSPPSVTLQTKRLAVFLAVKEIGKFYMQAIHIPVLNISIKNNLTH